MRLDRLRIPGFGRFSDASLDFDPGLNLVYGPNEAGKSTLVECIVRVLFGFPEAHFNDPRKRYTPWRDGTPYRAALAYTLDDGRQLETERDFGREDVPTITRDALTKVDSLEFSGSRTVSPGAKLLGMSLRAYHAAAVVRAPEHELSDRDLDDGPRELAERLGKLVGAAGDSSAKQAQERLERLSRDIGGAPNATTTPLTKARAAVAEAERKQREAAEEFERWHALMEERSRALEACQAARDRLASAVAQRQAIALRTTRQRLRTARDAAARKEAAEALLRDAQGRSAVRGSGGDDAILEDLKIKHIRAATAAEEAESRCDDARSERAGLAERAARAKRDVEAAEAALRDAEAAIASLDPKPAPPTMRSDAVERLRQQSDQVDVLERRARTAEAQLSVAQLAPRPNLLFFLILIVAGLAIVAASAMVKNSVLFYAGIGFAGAAIVVLLGYFNALRQRRDVIVAHARASDEANAAHRAALEALDAEVARTGYSSVEALVNAFEARGKADTLEERRRLAVSQLEFARGEQQTIARRLDDLDALERAAREARSRSDAMLAALGLALDGAGVPPGTIGERLDAYAAGRRQDDAIVDAERDCQVADAQLAGALGGSTLDELVAQEQRLAAAVDSAPALPNAGDRGDAPAELEDAEAEVERCKETLIKIDARLAELDHRFPAGVAEYEERLEAARAEERRLAAVKAAADLARSEIARIAEHVHRNFVPALNAAASDAVSHVTGGRYDSAAVDPKDFTIRTTYPESAATGTLDPLSSGTREVFGLALRIAIARALGSGERPPMLLDDPLVHADPERSRAMLSYLYSRGPEGLQTIFFTQRGSALAAAREIGAKVIELTPVRA